MKLVVLVLAYNEESSIKDVLQSIQTKLLQLSTFESEIIVIDDGSTDQTSTYAREMGATVIHHQTNLGVGRAFHTGLDAAIERRSDILVNIDADLQFDPNELSILIDPITAGTYDFVCGDRFSDSNGRIRRPENMPVPKFYGNQAMTGLVNRLTDRSFTDVSCGYRAYSRKAMLMLNLTGKFSYTQESFIDLAFKELHIKNIPVSVRYYPERKSKVANNIGMYALRTLKIIIRTYRDYRPMLFFTYVSLPPFILSLFGISFIGTHFFLTGGFSPFKFIGFGALYLLSLSILLWIVGFVADMFVRVRMNQEKIIYSLKVHQQ